MTGARGEAPGASGERLGERGECRPGPEPAEGPVVAFQGEHGAFSEEALLDHFRGRACPLPCRAFEDVGEAVRSGGADFGLLPVENTLVGSVQGSHDVLADGGLVIVGEVILPIRHFLMGLPGAREEDLREVLSHPVALAQCTRYFRAHPGVRAMAVHDTAGAAREVAQRRDPTLAAIAPAGAARRYGLAILARDLQDRSDNQTRFYLVQGESGGGDHGVPACGPAAVASLPLGVPDSTPGGPDPVLGAPGPTPAGPDAIPAAFRTVLLLELRDRPGALLRVLEPFARRGIDLSRIESRPAGDPWRYRFLLELRVDGRSHPARTALEEVARETTRLRVLGSFPMGR